MKHAKLYFRHGHSYDKQINCKNNILFFIYLIHLFYTLLYNIPYMALFILLVYSRAFSLYQLCSSMLFKCPNYFWMFSPCPIRICDSWWQQHDDGSGTRRRYRHQFQRRRTVRSHRQSVGGQTTDCPLLEAIPPCQA